MKGRKPKPSVTVQRAFVPTRLSDDLMAQAYDHVLQGAQQATPPQGTLATPTTRSRKRRSRMATTGGRKS
jgi:hypothetical protein